jgi:hypothetical protein
MLVDNHVYYNIYQCNGSNTSFSAGFPILDASQVAVTRWNHSTNEVTRMENQTGFTVHFTTGTNGYFTINTNTVYPQGDRLLIELNVPFTMLSDYVEGESFPADMHEDALAKLTLEVQELKRFADEAITAPWYGNDTTQEFVDSLYQAKTDAAASASAAASSATAAANSAQQSANYASNASGSASQAAGYRDQVQQAANSAQAAISAQETAALNSISDQGATALSGIETARSAAVDSITQADSTAQTDIAQAKDSALNTIAGRVNDINAAGDNAIAAIGAKGDDETARVGAAGDAAVQAIEGDVTAANDAADRAEASATDAANSAQAAQDSVGSFGDMISDKANKFTTDANTPEARTWDLIDLYNYMNTGMRDELMELIEENATNITNNATAITDLQNGKADKFTTDQGTANEKTWNLIDVYNKEGDDYAEVISKISSINGAVARLPAKDFGTTSGKSQADLNTQFNDYAKAEHPEWATDGIPNAVAVRNQYDGHLWQYSSSTGNWTDQGLDTVQGFTNDLEGLIRGKNATGYVVSSVENGYHYGKVQGLVTTGTGNQFLGNDGQYHSIDIPTPDSYGKFTNSSLGLIQGSTATGYVQATSTGLGKVNGITTSGSGDQFLGNDGNYHTISVGGGYPDLPASPDSDGLYGLFFNGTSTLWEYQEFVRNYMHAVTLAGYVNAWGVTAAQYFYVWVPASLESFGSSVTAFMKAMNSFGLNAPSLAAMATGCPQTGGNTTNCFSSGCMYCTSSSNCYVQGLAVVSGAATNIGAARISLTGVISTALTTLENIWNI